MFNMGKFQRSGADYMQKLKQAIKVSFEVGAQQALAQLRANPPFKNRTGQLLNSTKPYVRVGNLALSLKFRSSAPHASYLEHGTKPHVIVPSNKQFLRFYWEKVGKVVFARAVRHPGTKPTHFLERTRDNAAKIAMSELHRRAPRK